MFMFSRSRHFSLIILLFFSTLTAFGAAKRPTPEALPSPLSGLNSIGSGLRTDDTDSVRDLGSAWSQVWMGARQPPPPHTPRLLDGPEAVTTTIGGNAFLPCSVQHLGDRTVTWMRQRDLHILTAGVLTYSADERFRVLHKDNSPEWTLHIKMVTPRDAGIYECQVNSDPKISKVVSLSVKEPSQLDDPGLFAQTTDAHYAYDYYYDDEDDSEEYQEEETLHRRINNKDTKQTKESRLGRMCRRWRERSMNTAVTPSVSIEGPEERYIQEGSVLALTCLVTHQRRRAPAHLLWFRGTERLDYNSARGGVSVQTEKMASRTLSRLMISDVRTRLDSGEYSCTPTDLPTAVVTVHVQRGQHHAAVHQSVYNTSPPPLTPSTLHLITTFLLFTSLSYFQHLTTYLHPHTRIEWG